MSDHPTGTLENTHKTLAKRARHEIIQYISISTYLYVYFGALLLYKAAVLHGQGINFGPFGIAIVKALILGKFILIGQALKLSGDSSSRRLVIDVFWKSMVFVVFLIILSVIEEVVVSLIHGRPIHQAFAGIAGGTLAETLAASFLLLLILIPYFGIKELSSRLEEGVLMKLLTARQPLRS